MKKLLFSIIFIMGALFSQTPSWITTPGDVDFSGWISSSADVYRPLHYFNGSVQSLLFVNISTGRAAVFHYYAKSPEGFGWWALWDNNGSGRLNSANNTGWLIGSNDAYVEIESPGGYSFILSLVRTGGWAMLSQHNGSNNWNQIWNNSGSNSIGGWNIRSDDKYVSGNFHSGSSQHELFSMNPNGHASLNYYSGGSWTNVWGNGGNGNLSGQWTLSSSDRFYTFDYNGDGIDELLCVNGATSTAKILSNNGTAWTTVWTSNNGYISTRPISDGGELRINKFKESGNCDQLVILKNFSSYYASMHEFNVSTGWSEIWNNNGSQTITGSNWTMASGDAYVAPSRHLVAVNSSTASSMDFNGYPNTLQNLTISASSQGNPQLNWTASIDPDVTNNQLGIQIWKRTYNGVYWGSYSQVTAIPGNSSTYTDGSINNVGFGSKIAEYKIRAVDITGLQSPYTSPVQISYGVYIDQRKHIGFQKILPTDFEMEQNYPNPFNPSTTIRYGLPSNGIVKITVFDLLGRTIVKVFENEQVAGYHEVQFDASKLTSGIYIDLTPKKYTSS